MTLRPAVGSDVVQLEALVAAAFGIYRARMDREPAPMAADYRALVSANRVWVASPDDASQDGASVDGASQDGAILGMIVLVPAADHLYLETIAVRPDAQGAGVGGSLMELAETEASRLGLPAVVLCTNEVMTENLAYYPRRGYRPTHRIEQNGFRRVFFRKQLA